MANKQLQLRRGTAVQNNDHTGAEGEVTYVTDTKTLRVFDGSNAAGTELLKADMANVSAGGTTVTIDAKVQMSHNDYATVDGDSDLTLATKGWVSTQGSGGGLVGSQNNIGDTSITSATLGDFLVYQGASAASSAKWTNQTISGDVNVSEAGASVIQANAVETAMILDANVTNAKLANPNVVVTDGTTAHTLSLGNTLTFAATANETTVTQSGGTVTVGIVDAPSLGNVTASTLSVTNNLTISGNLTVGGSTTTVNTETINLADNLITLNSNLAGTADPTENGGIEINRGTLDNVSIRWNEGTDNWQVTEDGTAYHNLVHVGDTGTVSSAMIAGDAIDGSKIADDVINSEHYAALSIDNEHIANDTITSAKLADFTDTLTQTAGHIVASNGTLLTSYETAGDVGVTVSGGTLTFGITSGVIVNADINASADIAGSKLADNSVTTAQLANSGDTDTIQTANIADSAIAAAKIASQAVTAAKIHADVAGNGLSGANGSALAVDLSELAAATLSVSGDSIVFIDADDSNGSRKETVADFVDAFSGSHMTATNGVLAIDQFTGVTAGAVSNSKAVLVDGSSNISGFGVLAATTLTGTLNGQVSTATQNSITSIPNLATLGTVNSGAITSGFGSIDVGTSAITGGTITATAFAGPITGNVTGNVNGQLTGELQTTTQNKVTTMTSLASVGALNSGSITSGFTSIDVGTGAITGGTITGTVFSDGTASIQGGTLTANKVVVDNFTLDNGSLTQSTGALSITSGDNAVSVESVTFTGADVTGVGALTASGTVTANAFSGNASGTTASYTTSVTTGQAVVDNLTIDDTSITQGTGNLSVTASSGTVAVESVTFTGADVTGVGDLTASGVVTANTLAGNASGTTAAFTTSVTTGQAVIDNLTVDNGSLTQSTGLLTISSSDNSVDIESVRFAGQVVTNVSNLTASGTITADTFSGDLSGATATLSGAVTGGSVTDGTATLTGGNLTGLASAVVDDLTIDDTSITQGNNKSLAITATNGTVTVEDVVFTGGALTAVTDLTASGVVTASTFAGTLSTASQPNVTSLGTLSTLGVDQLTLNGNTISSSTVMQISAGTNDAVTIESVSINDAAVTGVATLSTSGDVTLGGDLAVNGGDITSTATALSISGSASVNVESVNFADGVITNATSFVASGAVQGGSVTDGTATLTGGALSGVTTIGAGSATLTGDLAVNGGDITCTATTLSLSAGTAVNVESVSFTDGAITGASALTATGALTGGSVTDGTATLTSGNLTGLASAVVDELTIDDTSITQAGAGGTKNLTLSASNGNVLVESVTFNGGAVTNVTNLTASNVITAATFVGAFSGGVSSDVLAASTLTVSTNFKLDTASFVIDNTAMTCTAAELNVLDGATAGSAVASKAVVLDSDLSVAGVKGITLNNTDAGEDALTITNGNVTVSAGNVVLTQGDLTVNSRFEIGPNSVVTSTADEMRFEDSLIELNYDANSLSDLTNLERHGGIWLQATKNDNTTTTGFLVDSDSDWYLIKDSARPNTNYLSGLSSKSRADLYAGGISSSAAVTRKVHTFESGSNTLGTAHHIVFSNNATAIVLPAAVEGREYIIRNIHASADVGIHTTSSQGLDGDTTNSTSLSAGGKLHVVSDGSNWYSV